MGPSARVLLQQYLLALGRGELGLVDRDLVLSRVGDPEPGRVAIEPERGQRVGLHADAVELAPGEHLCGARILSGGMPLEKGDIASGGGPALHPLDRVTERWGRWLFLGLLWRATGFAFVASLIWRGHATVGAVEVIKLRACRWRRHRRGNNQGKKPSHGGQYSRSAALGLGLACILGLAGCAEVGDAVDNVKQPGLLGRVIDLPPPPVAVVAGGASGVLLSGPYVPDVPDMAVDAVIGSGLKDWLTFEERQNLAMASQRAAVGVTGTSLPWDSQDSGDAVTASGRVVAVGDAFRSLRGPICRPVRQSFDKKGVPHAQTVTLCRTPIKSGIMLWVVAEIK